MVAKFDVNFIPANSSIINATISFFFFGTMEREGTCGIHRLETAFVDEKTTSWLSPWTNAGGDYILQADDVIQLRKVGDPGYNDFDVTNAIQEAVNDSSQNKGFILIPIADDGDKVCRKVSLSEGEKEQRPTLKVIYQSEQTVIKMQKNESINNIKISPIIKGKLAVYLKEANNYKITIYSLSGKQIKVVDIIGVKGLNSISIPNITGIHIVKFISNNMKHPFVVSRITY